MGLRDVTGLVQASEQDDSLPSREGGEVRAPQVVALIGIFTALTVALGYALVAVPNVELFSMMVFLAGFLFGKRVGPAVGTIASLIFNYLNPMGASHVVLLASQMALYALLGLSGALARGKTPLHEIEVSARKSVLFAGVGAGFVILSDACATFAQFLPTTWEAFGSLLVVGVPFTLVHLISNLLAFGCLIPVLINALRAVDLPITDQLVVHEKGGPAKAEA